MPISKVSRNYQVTIPKDVRSKAKIEKGDTVFIEYDEDEGFVKLKPPVRGKRKTWRLGAKLTVADIEADIERGQIEWRR